MQLLVFQFKNLLILQLPIQIAKMKLDTGVLRKDSIATQVLLFVAMQISSIKKF